MKISISKRSPRKSDFLVLTDHPRNLDNSLLRDEELSYLRKRHRNDDESAFSFNRFGQYVFVRIVGAEKSPSLTHEAWRKAGDSFVGELAKYKVKAISIVPMMKDPALELAFLEGMVLGSYSFLKYRKDALEKKSRLEELRLVSHRVGAADIERLETLSSAVFRARDLVNEPLSAMNAVKLAKAFQDMGKDSGAKVEVLTKGKIEALKMGGLLAVNRGSVDPPTFTIMEWKPDDAVNARPLILVGKGVVYDTGGLSLKPSKFMETMKCDMAGAAVMAATVYAVAKARLPVHVIGLIPATDNRPDGNAYTPGDIVRMYDGTTIEVLNTDAEGRMILADALAYARQYEPMLVIDAATLTGAAAHAIGHYGLVAMQSGAAGHFKELQQAGNRVFERVVEFPFWDDYKELLKSEVADMKNIGGPIAGMITAGKFLEHFTDYPFIHLDIAGPAFVEKRDSYRGIGGTGFGIRLLFDFLSTLAGKKQS